ncbi:hypothetical protein Tco_1574125, partial [Tanacetum coccineum]
NDDCEEIVDELLNDSDDKPVKYYHCSNLGMDSLQQDSCELKSEEFVIFDEETVIEGSKK